MTAARSVAIPYRIEGILTGTFNLRSLIREVADDSTIPDPTRLAEEVLKRIPKSAQRDALAQALPSVVSSFVARSRTPLLPQADAAERPRRVGSWKVAGVRETWRRMLLDRISVGPDASAWKLLRDCNAADLAYAEQVRRVQAAQNVAAADRFASLRDLLAAHGVTSVGELPDTALAPALSDAA